MDSLSLDSVGEAFPGDEGVEHTVALRGEPTLATLPYDPLGGRGVVCRHMVADDGEVRVELPLPWCQCGRPPEEGDTPFRRPHTKPRTTEGSTKVMMDDAQ